MQNSESSGNAEPQSSWVDQLIGAATPAALAHLNVTPAQLRQIRQELLQEGARKTLWVSLGMLLLHIPVLAVAIAIGNLKAGLVVILILVTLHVAAIGAAIRPSLVEFETPPLAYSRWRLAGLCYLAGLFALIWLPVNSGRSDEFVGALVLGAFLALPLFAIASPLLVLRWLNQTARTLPRQTHRPREAAIERVTPQKRTTPAELPEDKKPKAPDSWSAQFFGAMFAVVVILVIAQIWQAVTGKAMPLPFRRPMRVPQQVPGVPLQFPSDPGAR